MSKHSGQPEPHIAPLSPERWKTLEPIIDAAIELAAEHRQKFLTEACGGDALLLADLELLLADYDRRDTLLELPAAERFPSLLLERL